MYDMIRRIDELGRIVLPKDIRDANGWEPKDRIYLRVTNEGLLLSKVKPFCCVCGGKDNLITFDDQHLCSECLEIFNKGKKHQ